MCVFFSLWRYYLLLTSKDLTISLVSSETTSPLPSQKGDSGWLLYVSRGTTLVWDLLCPTQTLMTIGKEPYGYYKWIKPALPLGNMSKILSQQPSEEERVFQNHQEIYPHQVCLLFSAWRYCGVHTTLISRHTSFLIAFVTSGQIYLNNISLPVRFYCHSSISCKSVFSFTFQFCSLAV